MSFTSSYRGSVHGSFRGGVGAYRDGYGTEFKFVYDAEPGEANVKSSWAYPNEGTYTIISGAGAISLDGVTWSQSVVISETNRRYIARIDEASSEYGGQVTLTIDGGGNQHLFTVFTRKAVVLFDGDSVTMGGVSVVF